MLSILDIIHFLNNELSAIKELISFWINNGDLTDPDAIPLIPLMTTDNTPSGVASASSATISPAYQVFNRNKETAWITDTSSSFVEQWIQYTLFHSLFLFQKLFGERPIKMVLEIIHNQNSPTLRKNCLIHL